MGSKIDEDVLQVLESFGLTRLEAQVYLTIFMRGELGAREIVQTFKIHFPQLYSLVSNLERKGFIEIQEGRPKKYRVIDPKEIIQREKIKMEKNSNILVKSLGKMRKTEIVQKPSVWITRGIQNIFYNMNEMIKGAKFDVTAIVHANFVQNVVESLINKKKEGVQVYLVVYPKAPELSLIKKLKRVRTFGTCPFAILAIADCEKGLMAHGLPRVAPPEMQYGVVFEEPITPIFLSESFYEVWKRAKPISPEEDLKGLPKTFRSQRMAMVEIKNLLKRGEVRVVVKGRYTGSSDAFEGEGTVVGLTDNELHKNFILGFPDGRTLTIGGFYSMLEDIEAERITILKVG